MRRIEGKRKPVCFTQEQLDRLQKVMARHQITESEAIRRMLDLGLDVYEDFLFVGVPQMAEMTKKIKNLIYDLKQPRLFRE